MSYSYNRSVTINHAYCGGSDSSSFPALFAGYYSYLATTSNGGKVENANGYDICFFSDSGLTTKLDFEIDSYGTDGTVAFWVRIPTLSHSTDTTIYVAYGDASISVSQANPTGVWDTYYKGVYHLGSSLTADSTSNNSYGTLVNSPTSATGQIAGGIGMDGTAYQKISITDNSSFSTVAAGDWTLECWLKPNTALDHYVYQSYMQIAGSNYIGIEFAGGHKLSLVSGDSLRGVYDSSVDGVWVHLVGTKSGGGTTFTFYKNGSPMTNVGGGDSGYGCSGTTINGPGFSSSYAGGIFDECRISSTARSADWILAEYNNQYSPSTFYTVGSESSGSTAYSQTLSATSATMAASTVKASSKLVVATAATMAASVTRATNKLIAAVTATMAASCLKALSKGLSASMSAMAATTIRATSKLMASSTAAFTANLGRAIAKSIAAVMQSASATVSKGISRGFSAAMSAMSGSVSGVKALLKILTATMSAMTGSMQRSISKGLSASTFGFVGSTAKNISKLLSAIGAAFSATFNYHIPNVVYHPQPLRTLRVPVDSRVFHVSAEDRTFIVPAKY